MEKLTRRTFIRAGAVSLGLPMLDAMLPEKSNAGMKTDGGIPSRMVLIHRPLGTYHPFLVPEKSGPDYAPTRYLKPLQAHRKNLTLISGISHKGYPNSHHTESAMFTGVSPEGLARADDIHNTISMDQLTSEKIGHLTRVPSLTLNTANCASLSWNRKGVPVPWERSKANLFKKLFIDGTPDEIAREIKRLEHGRSILDGMRNQLKSLGASLGSADRERLELLASSIREAEKMLLQDEAWVSKPKPRVEATVRQFDQSQHWIESQQQWYGLIHLALQTDSTRVVVLGLGEQGQQNIPDLSIGHHDASHHGKDPAKIEQFARYEEKEYQTFAGFLDKLSATTEAGKPLLDSTQVLMASSLGDASAHSSDNLPVFLAGGGFKHKGHLAFDQKNNYQLSNLYVRMLQKMGIETQKFGASTGILGDLG
ncbi:DUF1552 domain-containing protein [bacterium]|nr:DUF1552 domain-containing protein [bacterium]